MHILTGLEKIIVWTLKKTKIKKQDPKLIWALEFSLQLVSYPIVGVLPGEIQKREAEQAGINPLKFTAYSIGYTALSAGAKYFFGEMVEDKLMLEYVGMGFQLWALIGNTTNIVIRTGYVAIKKRPVGSLIVEGFYHVLPHKLTQKYKSRYSA